MNVSLDFERQPADKVNKNEAMLMKLGLLARNGRTLTMIRFGACTIIGMGVSLASITITVFYTDNLY